MEGDLVVAWIVKIDDVEYLGQRKNTQARGCPGEQKSRKE